MKEQKGWIKSIKIEGITSENYNIVFCVRNSPSIYHGFKSFEVNWYYYCRDNFEYDKIQGFRISGPEVNYFYSPQIALKKEIKFKDDIHIERMQVSTTEEKTGRKCGKYSVKRGLSAEIEVDALATLHPYDASNPIDATSYMYFNFSKTTCLEDLVTAYYQVKNFYKYISYRNNICFETIDTYYLNDEQKRDYSGSIVFPSQKNTKKIRMQVKEY